MKTSGPTSPTPPTTTEAKPNEENFDKKPWKAIDALRKVNVAGFHLDPKISKDPAISDSKKLGELAVACPDGSGSAKGFEEISKDTLMVGINPNDRKLQNPPNSYRFSDERLKEATQDKQVLGSLDVSPDYDTLVEFLQRNPENQYISMDHHTFTTKTIIKKLQEKNPELLQQIVLIRSDKEIANAEPTSILIARMLQHEGKAVPLSTLTGGVADAIIVCPAELNNIMNFASTLYPHLNEQSLYFLINVGDYLLQDSELATSLNVSDIAEYSKSHAALRDKVELVLTYASTLKPEAPISLSNVDLARKKATLNDKFNSEISKTDSIQKKHDLEIAQSKMMAAFDKLRDMDSVEKAEIEKLVKEAVAFDKSKETSATEAYKNGTLLKIAGENVLYVDQDSKSFGRSVNKFGKEYCQNNLVPQGIDNTTILYNTGVTLQVRPTMDIGLSMEKAKAITEALKTNNIQISAVGHPAAAVIICQKDSDTKMPDVVAALKSVGQQQEK